jgi:receptor protein-tyrosine kinase
MTIIERAIQAARARAASTSAETAGTGEAPTKPARGAGRVTPLPRPTHDSPDQVMPFPRFDAGGSLVTEVTDPKIYEQFRRLKRPLLQCAFGPLATPGTQTIMITSPLQGAGKTFVSSNLAYALALEKDRNVLLIDTDNANPTLTRQMGLIGRPGLYDLISDTALTLEQVVCRTDIPGLWILPAGKTAPDSLELLNSHRCQEIFSQLAERDPDGIIILDAPPLLITNEAPAVTVLAGQFLLVVESGVTPTSSVTRALGLLDAKKPIGLVLNKARGHNELGSYYPTYPYPAS